MGFRPVLKSLSYRKSCPCLPRLQNVPGGGGGSQMAGINFRLHLFHCIPNTPPDDTPRSSKFPKLACEGAAMRLKRLGLRLLTHTRTARAFWSGNNSSRRCEPQHERHSSPLTNLAQRILKMATGLSSNWKSLQAKLQQKDNTTPTSTTNKKRKAIAADTHEPPLSKKPKGIAITKIPGPSTSRKEKLFIQRRQPLKAGSMGAATSQPIKNPSAVSAAFALWAADHDLSPEAVSEAYKLGSTDDSMLTVFATRVNEGLAPGLEVGKYIAIDCEMVGTGERGSVSALARVSVVDFHGRQVYDSYVRPTERVTDWRTWVSGVAPKHMATAREFEVVQREIAALLKGRILVGHDIRNDLEVLHLDHPRKDIRDTARFSGFKKYGNGPKPALRKLAMELLNVEIQTGQHSSLEDARVTMLLFRKNKPAFDVEHANRHPEPIPQALVPKVKPAKKKTTKKKRRN